MTTQNLSKSNGSASNAIPLSTENMEKEIHRLKSLNQELEAALREMVDAQDATVEQFTATEIDRLEKSMRVSREVLARAKPAERRKNSS